MAAANAVNGVIPAPGSYVLFFAARLIPFFIFLFSPDYAKVERDAEILSAVRNYLIIAPIMIALVIMFKYKGFGFFSFKRLLGTFPGTAIPIIANFVMIIIYLIVSFAVPHIKIAANSDTNTVDGKCEARAIDEMKGMLMMMRYMPLVLMIIMQCVFLWMSIKNRMKGGDATFNIVRELIVITLYVLLMRIMTLVTDIMFRMRRIGGPRADDKEEDKDEDSDND